MNRFFYFVALFIWLTRVVADSKHSEDSSEATTLADDHAPILVMGEHTHRKGEWMLFYRFMHMEMTGNKIDSDGVTPETIVTTVPNRFFGQTGQPPTLRVVPTEMSMDMHMLGGMYAPSDWLTIMAMTSYQEKEMEHITFAGGSGINRRGDFTTRSSGIGDLKISSLFSLFKNQSRGIVGLGISFPAGSTSDRGTILAPSGTTPTIRLPYAMQNGSGTLDFLPSLTYSARSSKIGWGGQWKGIVRTNKGNGYNLGNRHEFAIWLSYRPVNKLSTSLRVLYQHSEKIEGIDQEITLPVQTADPNNYGGEKVNLLFGINWVPGGALKGLRIAIEGGLPIHQDLNGPQMKNDYLIGTGIQFSF